jgi:hypothetical protein
MTQNHKVTVTKIGKIFAGQRFPWRSGPPDSPDFTGKPDSPPAIHPKITRDSACPAIPGRVSKVVPW